MKSDRTAADQSSDRRTRIGGLGTIELHEAAVPCAREKFQVHELRQPEVQAMAGRLQTHMKRVATTLRSQKIDFETVKAMSDDLGDVSQRERDGHDTAMSKQLLDQFEHLYRMHVADRDRLEKELDEASK